MPSPFNQILFKAEDAVAIRIATASLGGAVIHKGGGNSELALPFISVVATRAEIRQPIPRGNVAVSVQVDIHTSIDDDSRADRVALIGAVADVLTTDSLATDLSSDVADFRCLGAILRSHSQSSEGRHHVHTIELELHCAPSDV